MRTIVCSLSSCQLKKNSFLFAMAAEVARISNSSKIVYEYLWIISKHPVVRWSRQVCILDTTVWPYSKTSFRLGNKEVKCMSKYGSQRVNGKAWDSRNPSLYGLVSFLPDAWFQLCLKKPNYRTNRESREFRDESSQNGALLRHNRLFGSFHGRGGDIAVRKKRIKQSVLGSRNREIPRRFAAPQSQNRFR